MRVRATSVGLAVFALASLSRAQNAPAAAENLEKGAVCSESYQQAQITRREGKSALLAAREAARTCLSSSCQAWMTADCSQWLSDLDARIPTVVFAAKNSAERDLVDVAVSTLDGQPLASRLDGHSVDFEPGQHTFVFVTKDGARLEKQAIVREGAKAQIVSAVFEAAPEELEALQRARRVDVLPPPAVAERSNVMRGLGFGTLGMGTIALGIGTGFGISALMRKNDLSCDPDDRCDADGLQGGKTAADVSTAAFIAGGVLAAGGLVMVLWPRSAARVTAQPSIGPSRAGLQLGGRF